MLSSVWCLPIGTVTLSDSCVYARYQLVAVPRAQPASLPYLGPCASSVLRQARVVAVFYVILFWCD